ncbi:hypothetical protein EDD16DRAFT_423050 [Pisolithus croceorrhizus]|nr:hypothetical protein EDD16DRAFT_423050 [Pisolithus croceorrhizus]KAI6128541.1 hypothetical protein EV401DRAFT_892911 [Pisolithus croceorrhizus]KAI6159372.1 hypothetical protein EDD17DRAFT_900881 [Pisolithus thermaeus]
MERDPSYPTQSCSVPAVSDYSWPSLSWDAVHPQLLQEEDPSQMLCSAEYYSDSEDVLPPTRTIPPLTRASEIRHQGWTYPVLACGHPVDFFEDDHYYPSRLTWTSALAPLQETCRTQSYAPHPLHVTGEVESLVASMQPSITHSLPHAEAHTLKQMCPLWNSQDLGVDNAGASYSPQPVENNGGSSTLPPFKPPPRDTVSLAIDDTIQVDGPKWTTDHANSINPGTLTGHRESQALTFRGVHESQTPFPYTAPPSGHVLPACSPTLACPQITLNIAEETLMNVGKMSLPPDYTAPQPGGGEDHGWMGGNYHASGEVAPLPYSNEPCLHRPYSPHCICPHNTGNPSTHEGSPEADHPRAGSSMSAPAAYVAHDRTAPKLCGWRDVSGGTCNIPVTYDNMPHHLRTFHGIEGIAANVEIECRWCSPPKTLKRKSMVRHCREVHLEHPRLSAGTPVEF